MTVLFGHPAGNPNSHNAALAYFEAGALEAFCVPWMPSVAALRLFQSIGPLKDMARRLGRRRFEPLARAPRIEGRAGEWRRLVLRAFGRGDERLSYSANDWLMATMAREARRPRVTAIHAYEDCSLWQFEEAKRLGKACIYDLPIGYHAAWQGIEADLSRTYEDWLPRNFDRSLTIRRPQQKKREIELADLVLVPSAFVARTLQSADMRAAVAVAPYGVETADWYPRDPLERRGDDTLTFLFVGQCSVRKGTPLLLEAWDAARLKGARLDLVGPWNLAERKRKELPSNVTWTDAVPRAKLRERYQRADVFVFPTFFEGRSLAVIEALSSGLPILSTPACGVEDVIDTGCGRLIPVGDKEALIEGLRWFANCREDLPAMRRIARTRAELCRWDEYRRRVVEAVRPFC